jgi:hypothetical protein
MYRRLAACVLVGGCSLIYNTGNIPHQPPDAMLDAPLVPTALHVKDLSPLMIDEGQGDGGSRPAVLVLHGENFVTGAQVVISSPASISVDNSQAMVSHDGTLLAVPVTAHVDPAGEGTRVTLAVQVTQPDGMGGTVTQPLIGTAPTLYAHDELMTTTTAPKQLYSKIQLLTALGSLPPGGSPFILRSVSSLEIAGISAKGGDASGMTAGVAGIGGNPGGGQDTKGAGSGGGEKGTDGNSALLGGIGGDGGGGGFATAGGVGGDNGGGAGGVAMGDDGISNYMANSSSGGGGGGRNAGLTGGFGTAGGGGGGGGVIELTAGGDLMTGAIDVSGGVGAGGGASPGGCGGGGGTGGVIVLRAGGMLSAGTLTATGGGGGTATGSATGMGGAGSVGRIRWDNAAVGTVSASPAAVRGPSFVSAPLIATDPTLSIVGAPGKTVTPYINGTAGSEISLDGSGNASVTLTVAGYNRVCVVVAGGILYNDASSECIDVAYLPTR